MLVDFVHNSTIVEKMRFFAWAIFAIYMLASFLDDAFSFRNEREYMERECEFAGGKKTQMFVVLDGKVVFICLKSSRP